MKLPNFHLAHIAPAKIVDYLLTEENSGGKAAFFEAFGFTNTEWERLREALFLHAAEHPVTRFADSPHGIKYIIEGRMQTPDGRSPQVRAVWIIDTGQEAPRLVTAYPLEG